MKRLLLMVLLSFTLGFLGLYLVSREALLDPASYHPDDWSMSALLVSAAAFVTFWLAPVFRLRVLAGAHNFRLSFTSALTAHVLFVLGSAVTPGGSGGGPAIAVALQRLGVPWGVGIGVAVQSFVLDLIVFAWAVPLSLAYLILSHRVDLPPVVSVLALLSVVLAIGLAITLSRFPVLLVRLILWLVRRPLLRRFRYRLAGLARDYYRSAKAFMAMPVTTWLKLLVLGTLGWLGSFVLFYGLLTLYGVPIYLLDILSLLSIVTLVSFAIPTPGAAGFTELAVGLGVGVQVPAAYFAAPLLLWRLSSLYLVYLVGPLTGWLLLLRRPPRWLQSRWRQRPPK